MHSVGVVQRGRALDALDLGHVDLPLKLMMFSFIICQMGAKMDNLRSSQQIGEGLKSLCKL